MKNFQCVRQFGLFFFFFELSLFVAANAKVIGFFWSIHFCFSVAARPGNTICSSAMAEAVLAVFPSLSEIGRTSCTTSKIIFVRLCSSFAIPRAPEIRLIFAVFVYTERALRPACRALALRACTLFYTVLFQRCFAPSFQGELGLAVPTELEMKAGLRHPQLKGQSRHLALFSEVCP